MPLASDQSDLDFLRAPLLLAGVIGALALGWVASGRSAPWTQDAGPGDASAGAAACDTEHVSVAVAPAIYEPVAAALDGAGDGCVTVDVTSVASADVAAAASEGGPLPDVWIADATYWYSRAFLPAPASFRVLAGTSRTPRAAGGGRSCRALPDLERRRGLRLGEHTRPDRDDCRGARRRRPDRRSRAVGRIDRAGPAGAGPVRPGLRRPPRPRSGRRGRAGHSRAGLTPPAGGHRAGPDCRFQGAALPALADPAVRLAGGSLLRRGQGRQPSGGTPHGSAARQGAALRPPGRTPFATPGCVPRPRPSPRRHGAARPRPRRCWPGCWTPGAW